MGVYFRINAHWRSNMVLTSIKYKPAREMGWRLAYVRINRHGGYNVVLTSIKYNPVGEVGWR